MLIPSDFQYHPCPECWEYGGSLINKLFWKGKLAYECDRGHIYTHSHLEGLVRKGIKLKNRSDRMVNARDYLPESKYLVAEDIKKKRVSATLVITGDSIEEIKQRDGSTVEKLAITFDDTDKMLILNKTNMETIEDTLKTDETDDWKGATLKFVVTKVTFDNQLKDALRIEEVIPPPEAKKVVMRQSFINTYAK